MWRTHLDTVCRSKGASGTSGMVRNSLGGELGPQPATFWPRTRTEYLHPARRLPNMQAGSAPCDTCQAGVARLAKA